MLTSRTLMLERTVKQVAIDAIQGTVEGAGIGIGLSFFTGGFSLGIMALTAGFGALIRTRRTLFLAGEAAIILTKDREKSAFHLIALFVADLVTGAGVGAAAGALFGWLLAPLTFGLSIPICAKAGAVLGGMCSISNTVHRNFLRTRKESVSKNSYTDSLSHGSIWMYLGLAIGIALSPVTGGASLLIPFLTIGSFAAAGAVFGMITSYLWDKISPPTAQRSSVSSGGLKPYWQAKETLTSVGATMGTGIGALCGFLGAPFTFGASIPVCAFVGGFLGGIIGRMLAPPVKYIPRIPDAYKEHGCTTAFCHKVFGSDPEALTYTHTIEDPLILSPETTTSTAGYDGYQSAEDEETLDGSGGRRSPRPGGHKYSVAEE